jgi:electron transport complex protein RnfG
MRELVMMVVVLTLMSVASGGLLAAIRSGTAEQIENQRMKYDKAPAIDQIFQKTKPANNPVAERFKIQDDKTSRVIFPVAIDGKKNYVAIEGAGKGFSSVIGLMVAVNIENDTIYAARVTSISDTPGIGSKAKDNPEFVKRFDGLPVKEIYQVRKDGGEIDAMAGATVTSRGVCTAMSDAAKIYKRLKPQILENLNAPPK